MDAKSKQRRIQGWLHAKWPKNEKYLSQKQKSQEEWVGNVEEDSSVLPVQLRCPVYVYKSIHEEFLNSQDAEAQVRKQAKRDGSYTVGLISILFALTKNLLKGTRLSALMLAEASTLIYAFSSETQKISRRKI